MNLRVGDLARWTVNIDDVYSKDTKRFVGKVGVVENLTDKWGHTRWPNCIDITFDNNGKSFSVLNVHLDDLEKIDE